MENQDFSKGIMFKYGILLGVIIAVIEIANYFFGNIYEVPYVVSILTKLFFIGFIVQGIKSFKFKNNNLLSVGQAMKIGLGIALVAGVIGFIYQYLLMSYIEPEFVANAAEVQERLMLEQNPDMSDDQLEMVSKMTAMMSTPLILSSLLIAANLIGGLIVSLVAGLILKKEEVIF